MIIDYLDLDLLTTSATTLMALTPGFINPSDLALRLMPQPRLPRGRPPFVLTKMLDDDGSQATFLLLMLFPFYPIAGKSGGTLRVLVVSLMISDEDNHEYHG